MMHLENKNREESSQLDKVQEPQKKGIRCRWMHIIIAILVYIAAHIVDGLFTVRGVAIDATMEANPVLQIYMDCFGVGKGLLICKSLMGAVVIPGMIVAHMAYEKRRSKFRVEYILYAGSFLTFLGGALWITKL
jgi:hypothetical protein